MRFAGSDAGSQGSHDSEGPMALRAADPRWQAKNRASVQNSSCSDLKKFDTHGLGLYWGV